jgi:hypothetical protein
MQKMLHDAIYGDQHARGAAHRGLRQLGPVGRFAAQEVLRRMLIELQHDAHLLSEVAYTLGDLAPRENKDVLMELVETELDRGRSDPPARALTVLRPALVPADIPQLQAWLPRAEALHGDPDSRVAVYLRYLIVYVKYKFRSDSTRPV